MIYNLHQYFCNVQKIFTPFRKNTMETRMIKNVFKDLGTSKPKKHANKVGRLTYDPKLNKPLPYKPTALCILLYSGVSTYVGLY